MLCEDTVFLFDIHGTLAENKQMIKPEIKQMLIELKEVGKLAFVTGSEIEQAFKQLGSDCLELFDYAFAENGTQFYKNGTLMESKEFLNEISEENYQKLINMLLKELSNINLPVKRGQFLTLRNSTLNVCPIGRSCTVEERIAFYKHDQENKIRVNLVENIKKQLHEYNLDCAIGGQISIDIFPQGWDKTFCLRHLKEKNIYFFGDKTEEGENDFDLFINEKTKGFKVKDPSDTLKILKQLKTNNNIEV